MKPSLLSSVSQPTTVQSDSSLPSSPALELLESKKKGQVEEHHLKFLVFSFEPPTIDILEKWTVPMGPVA
jgi:hypothetical protein